jgi:glucose-1-phosphate adenylyltransferase
MPGAVVQKGAVVKYAIIGENTEIGEEAVVGCAPYQGEGWGIATCGPDLKIRPGAQVPANAMIYTSEEV